MTRVGRDTMYTLPRPLGSAWSPGGLMGVLGGISLDQRVTSAGVCLLSPSLDNDYILPVLSTLCSVQTGLHPSSPHTEGVVRGGVQQAGSLLRLPHCASGGHEKGGAAPSPGLSGKWMWLGRRRLGQECSEVPCGFVSLCRLAAACRFLMGARIRGWSQNPSGAVVWEVRILVLFWVSESPGSSEKPLSLASSPSGGT